MGPDEFHEKLPGSDHGGLRDNAYTNIMVSWLMSRSFRILEELPEKEKMRIMKTLSLEEEDLSLWKEVMHGLALQISKDGVVEQFEGYFGLKELDWDHYREKYGDIHRLDRILKAEDRSPDAYKLSKQADFLMTFYNLGEKEVSHLIQTLGYRIPQDYFRTNFDYYLHRTSHGSTLSRLVHARLAWKMGDKETGWGLYLDALRSDLVDIQGGTTGEGIHCGVMAGTVVDVVYTYAGLEINGDIPGLHPTLPERWKSLEFGFLFRGLRYQVRISGKKLTISCMGCGKKEIKVDICGTLYSLAEDKPETITIP